MPTESAATGPLVESIAGPGVGPTTEAMADKVFAATLGAFELLGLYVGDRSGWSAAMADGEPTTAAELATRTGTRPRYCREWLESLAAGGYLSHQRVDGVDRFTMPPSTAEVLTDEHSLSYLAGLPRLLGAIGPRLPDLLRAYRDGGGVSWADFGDDAREAQAGLNRPWFEQRLAPALRSSAQTHAALGAPGVRIADVGCGAGWSTLALARAYPGAQLVGLDVDAPSIAMARRAAEVAELTDRVRFEVADGQSLGARGSFDAAFLFECLHDMPRPVDLLSAVRDAVGADGLVVVMDEAVTDELTAPADEVDRFMYGCSLFICLPDGLSASPSEGTGTVFRRPVLEQYARRAGYSSVTVLPIEDFSFFRFYRLHP